MGRLIQSVKWSPEKGQFIVRIDSLITEVVDSVADALRHDFGPEVIKIQNLVWYKSSPDYSALVVTARYPLMMLELLERMEASMKYHVADALQARSVARAS